MDHLRQTHRFRNVVWFRTGSAHRMAAYVIQPKGEYTKTIIFVHGRGSSGEEFANELFEGRTSSGKSLIDLEDFESDTKWIFPSARERNSTVFQLSIPEWFDIYSLSDPNAEQELQKEGIKESVENIHSIINSEISSGIKPGDIILGGISQGFAVAVHALLASSHRLGGFIGLSGWFPFSNKLPSILDCSAICSFYKNELGITASTSEETFAIPVLVTHAKNDGTVEAQLGQKAATILQDLGFDVEWHEYDQGDHWISEPKGYDDIARFMAAELLN